MLLIIVFVFPGRGKLSRCQPVNRNSDERENG